MEGVAVAARLNISLTRIEGVLAAGRVIAVQTEGDSLPRGSLTVVSVYLITGQGASEDNLGILAVAGEAACRGAGAFVIGGAPVPAASHC